MDEQTFSLVQECTNQYSVENLSEAEVEIRIQIPKKFKFLWLIKLSELSTDEKEIKEYKDD